MGAALQFAHLDYDAATTDFTRRRDLGQSIPHIVRVWRISPPTIEDVAADVPYSKAWFARMKRENPQYTYSDDQVEDELPDDQADDENLVEEVEP